MKPNKIFLFAMLICVLLTARADAVGDSSAWKKLLDDRTTVIITEALDLGGLKVGGRGKIAFTWLNKELLKTLNADKDVSEVISNGLSFYLSAKPSIAPLMKGKDVFLLTYYAIKRWDFKVEEIKINGYRLSQNDILNDPFYRVLGEIPPIKEREKTAETDDDLDDFVLHVAVPSLPKSGKIKISYGEDEVEWQIPKR